MTDRHLHRRGLLLGAGGALCWSVGGLLVRNVEGAGSWQIVFWRALFFGLTILAVLVWRYRGRLVELGPVKAVCAAPAHPYTKALIAAVLEPDPDHDAGRIPAPRERDDRISAGCPYAGRCSIRIERCFDEMPHWHDVAGGQMARCFLLPAAVVAL